jgi:hypothetical protein
MTTIKCWKYNPGIPLDFSGLRNDEPHIILNAKRTILKTGIKSIFDRIDDDIFYNYVNGGRDYIFVDGCGPNFIISSLSASDKIIYLSKTNSILTKPIIFFSFQTDFKKSSEKIEEIIKAALGFLKKQHPHTFKNLQLQKARDTGDGAVNISETIIKKIKQATLFIGDITLVGKYTRQDKKEKYYINTNVSVETGYALSAIPPQHIIIACMGEVFGESIKYDIEDKQIPFDLSSIHRVLGKNEEEFCKNLIKEIIDQLYKIYKVDSKDIEEHIKSIYRKL